MTDRLPVTRALLSVSDKTGLAELGRALAAAGAELVSTGGSAGALRAAGLAVREVAELTGLPEMLGGRVKTLHPAVHGGILARRDEAGDRAAMAALGIGAIDLVVVSLYPFEAAVAAGADAAACIEAIDIGGPALIRAGAKNHRFVTVLTDPADYAEFLAELAAGGTTAAFRSRMAQAAFGRTAAYDAAVAGWMADAAGLFAPRHRALAGRLVQSLRYGENPHQRAAFYADGSGTPGVATARQVQGKALSYNNIADADAALDCLADLGDGPACVIVKHANPCGAARGATIAEAYGRAFDCDRAAAFGGIVAVNRPLDAAAAARIAAVFTEVVIAPEADAAACAALAGRADLRLLLTGALPSRAGPGLAVRQVAGGFLVQDRDSGLTGPDGLRCVTARPPTPAETADLLFAWAVAKHVKSNAIVYVRDGATVGIGAGQVSRVDAARIGARKAADMAATLGLPETPARGAAVASDAFFPFADGLLAVAEAGASAVIQPGGSRRDAEVIAAADAAGLAMVFTGRRHFRH
jgi:phosphoribosylaminoimidazolecarboxamide formyltransferase/IMP cyclohydrolase